MKKIQMLKENNLTFKDGCEKCKTTIFVVNNALLIHSTYTYMYTLLGGGSTILRHKESVKFYKKKESL